MQASSKDNAPPTLNGRSVSKPAPPAAKLGPKAANARPAPVARSSVKAAAAPKATAPTTKLNLPKQANPTAGAAKLSTGKKPAAQNPTRFGAPKPVAKSARISAAPGASAGKAGKSGKAPHVSGSAPRSNVGATSRVGKAAVGAPSSKRATAQPAGKLSALTRPTASSMARASNAGLKSTGAKAPTSGLQRSTAQAASRIARSKPAQAKPSSARPATARHTLAKARSGIPAPPRSGPIYLCAPGPGTCHVTGPSGDFVIRAPGSTGGLALTHIQAPLQVSPVGS